MVVIEVMESIEMGGIRSCRTKGSLCNCSLHRCVLLKGSLYEYGQVRHRGDNVRWICSILLDVRISNSFGTDVWEECKVYPYRRP